MAIPRKHAKPRSLGESQKLNNTIYLNNCEIFSIYALSCRRFYFVALDTDAPATGDANTPFGDPIAWNKVAVSLSRALA
jgi:hypothetical protein